MKLKFVNTMLLVLLAVSARPQKAVVNWAKQLGGDYISETAMQSTALDAAGNVYIAGTFVGTADFDPGPGVRNLTSAGTSNSVDAYILKLDPNGNFLWVRQVENEQVSRSFSIAVATSGHIYVSGLFAGTADFDPGSDVFPLTTLPDGESNFLLKLDNNGNFVWAKQFISHTIDYITTDDNGFIYGCGSSSCTLTKTSPDGTVMWERHLSTREVPEGAPAIGSSIAIDNLGNVYGGGTIYGDCDFDPGPAEYYIHMDNTSGNGFAWKLDNNGTFIWAKYFQDGHSEVNTITADAQGNILTAGFFDQPVDFDPGAGAYLLAAPGERTYQHIFVSKLDNDGNFIWAKPVYGNFTNPSQTIKADAQSNVYISGTFLMTYDFDPGPASYEMSAPGSLPDIYILKLNSSGNFVWARPITGCGPNESYGMALDDSNNILITGISSYNSKFDSVIFDEPLNTHFIAKFSQSETPPPSGVSLAGKIWNDLNKNGIDNNEPGITNLTVLLYRDDNNDNLPDECFAAMTTTDAGGNYSFSNQQEGNYFIEIFLPQFEGYAVNTVNGGDPDNNIDGDNNGTTLTNYDNTTEEVVRGKSITLTANGEPGGLSVNSTYDIGLLQWTLCIGNRVFNDINKNGRDNNEPGLGGVNVRLYSVPCKNHPITSATEINGTTTDENGFYNFCYLKPGYYIVSVDLPQEYKVTKNGVKNPDNNKNHDNNGAYSNTGSVWGGAMTLREGAEPEGNTNNTYDFALHITGCGEEEEEEEESKALSAQNIAEVLTPVKNNTAHVYPNPFTDKIQIELQNENAATASIRIYTAQGKPVRDTRQVLLKGANTFTITGLERLAYGIYFIEIKTAEKTITQKLIKL